MMGRSDHRGVPGTDDPDCRDATPTGHGGTAAPDDVPGVPRLLDGLVVSGGVSLTATATLIGHLELLGATRKPDETDGTTTGAGDALRLNGETGDAALDCTVSWAGPVDRDLTDEVGVQAACGLMAVHGRAEGGPSRIAVDYASVAAGIVAGQAVLATVHANRAGADIRQVETSVAQTALLTVSQYLAVATTDGDDDAPPASPLAGRRPPFLSADGVRFELETLDAGPWQRFWTLLEAPEPAIRRGWRPMLLRYANATSAVPLELHDTLRRHPWDRIVAVAAESGVSLCPIRSEADRHAEIARRPLPPWSVRPHPGITATGLPARPGTPTADAPLAGLCVVEATRRVQGPLAAHLLGLLGARVIRIEPPGGDPLRGMPPMLGDVSSRFLALNRTKETVEIDIKDPADRDRLRALVADADVFLHNWLPGRAERLGLGAADFARVNPQIVYAYASAWGDEVTGEPPLGTDFMVQAYSGLATQVFADGNPPRPSLMTLLDVLGGLLCTEGVLVGLLARQRDGVGQLVDTSLLGAATQLQTYTGRRAGVGGEAPPWQVWDRPLTTNDGAVAVRIGTDADVTTLFTALGLDPVGRDPAHLVSRTAGQSGAELAARLRAAGLSATEVTTDLDGLGTDPRFTAALTNEGACFVRAPWRFLP
ncbi:CoA transferase [Micromonospora echinofusca]|nr:CoA transferase [Micromonospora echinofusca]